MTEPLFPNRLSAKEAAEKVGVNIDTLKRFARERKIAGYKVGKGWTFDVVDIQTFIASRRVPAAEQQ